MENSTFVGELLFSCREISPNVQQARATPHIEQKCDCKEANSMPHCLQKCVLHSGATAFLLHIMWLAIGLQSAKGTSGTPTISCGIFTANSCPPSGPLVVMKRVSRSTPPNVTLVGDFTGTSTTMSTRPSRVRRMTRDAPEIATHT